MSSSKMNISSLLSPQPPDPPRRQPSSQPPSQTHSPHQQHSSPYANASHARDSDLNAVQRSTSFAIAPPDTVQRRTSEHYGHPAHSTSGPAGSHNSYGDGSPRHVPTTARSPLLDARQYNAVPQPSLLHRPSYTEKMEFLAGMKVKTAHGRLSLTSSVPDIASMQHHQQQQSLHPDSHSSRLHADAQDIRRSPSMSDALPITRWRTADFDRSRRPSLIPTAGDHPMSDAPTATLDASSFKASSLSQLDLRTISELIEQLKENSYLFESHVRLINLLHQGFVSHVCPSDAPETLGDPLTYPLLRDLRQAREAMDSRFPVGEDLWIDWLQDECMLASSIEDRVAVMELCQKAVQDEMGSSRLWRLYGDWMWILYKSSTLNTVAYENNTLEHHSLVGMVLANQSWSDEEKLVGQEVFGWDTMMNVWRQGAQTTAWHINSSHLVWQPYLEIAINDLYRNPTSEKVQQSGRLLTQRLQQPHSAWDETFQLFSHYVTKYDNASYEDIMVKTSRQSATAKHEFAQRQEFESRLLRAAEHAEKDVEWTVFIEYLEWEVTQSLKRNPYTSAFDLRTALHERANLRFPNDTQFWEDHIDLAQDNASYSYALLTIAENATRHCPWSGNLWSRRLSALEATEKEFSQLEEVKHHATSTGLLEELGGIEEIIKVHTSWCGFLRRRAFAHGSGEEERDVAEVGILSAVEDIRAIGEKKFGKEFKGDPHFRTERIYLNFLMQARRLDEARKFWAKLVTTHADSYEFWDRYYLWEMVCWGRQLNAGLSSNDVGRPPEYATAVLQSALRRPNLDWPEKIINAYLHHCAQFESIAKVQESQVEARRATKQVVRRRTKEAAAAAEIANGTGDQGAVNHIPLAVEVGDFHESSSGTTKRKRGTEVHPDEAASPKRLRDANETTYKGAPNDTLPPVEQIKRNRENTTVLVKKLPTGTTEAKVRQFFRDCGRILDVHIISDSISEATTATVEFESKEDVLAAQTKGMKPFEGNDIEIQVGTGTTLWVTNYPPEADEGYLRSLFEPYGDVVEVRFPSLKLNTHRRFCYVQFLTPNQAKAATQLDGKAMGGKLYLNAKISDPSAKKNRQGAMHEGREIHVGNLDYETSEEEVKTLFQEHGRIESVRIPRNMVGKSKGTAFVSFASQEGAKTALVLNLKEFKSRILQVTMSIPNATGAKRMATSIIGNANDTPISRTDIEMNGNSPSADSQAQQNGIGEDLRERANDRHARTIALLNVPDTVNDARIRNIMEKYGPLRKIVLRPDHAGAIIEFENIADVGKAELGITGFEILPGKKLGVGSVTDMLREKEDSRLAMPRPGQVINRPGQVAAKRGGRGGLGFKRAEGASSTVKPTGGKSNADFRAMITK